MLKLIEGSVTLDAMDRGEIDPPKFFTTPNTICYEVITGSHSYGMDNTESDVNIYGFCMPPLEILYPHRAGTVQGFHNPEEVRFDQFTQHNIFKSGDTREHDFTIFNITKMLTLLMGGSSPNAIDTLFVDHKFITHMNEVGNIVRSRREVFLSKKACRAFRGYALNQANKMAKSIDQKGTKPNCALKAGAHLIRLLDEMEQIVTTGTIILGRNKEDLIAIRNGEWDFSRITTYSTNKITELDDMMAKSKLPGVAPYPVIRGMLNDCIETMYGSISELGACLGHRDDRILNELHQIIKKYGA